MFPYFCERSKRGPVYFFCCKKGLVYFFLIFHPVVQITVRKRTRVFEGSMVIAPSRQYSKEQCSERLVFAKGLPAHFERRVDVILDNFEAPTPIDSLVTRLTLLDSFFRFGTYR